MASGPTPRTGRGEGPDPAGPEQGPADGGVPVALGLGSNLGDRLGHLRGALEALGAVGRVEATSSVYESPPAGYRDQPDFLNFVAILWTGMSPRHLMDFAEGVEDEAGRRRPFRNAPRTLDIDIILYGSRVVREPGLTVPHPRWRERPFVLVPLREVAAGWRDPVSGRTVAELTDHVTAEGPEIHRVAPPPRTDGAGAPEEGRR